MYKVMLRFIPIAEAMTEDERLRTAYRLLCSGTFTSWHFNGNGTHIIFEDGNINVDEHHVDFAEKYSEVTDLNTGKVVDGRSFIGAFMIAIMSQMSLRNKMKVVYLSGYSAPFSRSESLIDDFNVHDYEQEEYEKLLETETYGSLLTEAFSELEMMAKNNEINYDPKTFQTHIIYDMLKGRPDIDLLYRETQDPETLSRIREMIIHNLCD